MSRKIFHLFSTQRFTPTEASVMAAKNRHRSQWSLSYASLRRGKQEFRLRWSCGGQAGIRNSKHAITQPATAQILSYLRCYLR